MRECLAYLDVGNQIVEEGPLAAERFQGPVRLDASMVDPARQIVKPFGAVAEMRRQPRHLLRRQVGPREDAKPFHLRRRHRADAVERSEEHTSELQSLMRISYAVFCLKKKKQYN